MQYKYRMLYDYEDSAEYKLNINMMNELCANKYDNLYKHTVQIITLFTLTSCTQHFYIYKDYVGYTQWRLQ